MPVSNFKEPSEALKNWINDKLSSILDFPVPQDLIQYIVSIENPRDLKEYLGTLINLNDAQHLQFYTELLQRRHGGLDSGSDLQSYRKSKEENYVTPKDTGKKKKEKGKANRNQDDGSRAAKDTVKEITAKRKTKFINLYSQEGQAKDVVLLKGRHRCDCQASKHGLINNCLHCGRIVCEQEGSGPCFVCKNLVCTQEQQQVLNAGSKQSDYLYKKLLEQKPQALENAIQQRNRLLEYDRTSQKRTHVIDDESDYFSSNSSWLTKEEREKLQKLEAEMRAKRHSSRLDRKVTLDFAGRKVVEEDDMQDLLTTQDRILQEISESINSPRKYVSGNNVHPGMTCPQPIYQEVAIPGAENYIQRSYQEDDIRQNIHRVQDRELLEMSDDGYCLSMHQPWASLLVAGIKQHEGRMWYTAHRGRLWIAATAKPPLQEDIKEVENMYEVLKGDRIKFPSSYPTSCLLGCVNVVDCLPQEEYRERYPDGESESPFVFICEDPQELPIRFPIQGKHKIYKLDPKIHQAAQKSLQRLKKIQSERASCD
ncbi:activating signal cointegrator 1 [Schistocerca nitens]|uniref:activating signal cointegrator 1 n=1 Tax=Schistocerca nitens TaxID=7011 RepID=UPI002118E78F|nr:activating signal cointegrator 1 [Schistocerca nitens]